jgi:regulator of protease activity HflC (stomatin/prohibitin superfamily)
MPPQIILAALCALMLLAIASIRRVPEGHVYTFRRMDGRLRIVGSGTHLVVPLIERVAHKISLAGATTAIDDLVHAEHRYRAVVYFQVLDPQRADVVIQDIENVLHAATRRLFVAAMSLDELNDMDACRRWLKQHLNDDVRENGLLITRVDLAAA